MSPIISKNKYFILADNGNTNITSVMNARQPETVYPQSSNESNDDNNSSNNNLILNNDNNSEDDGEWVVKASVKRQPRRRSSHHNNNAINTENDNRNYLVEDDSNEEDGYMSWTEHELSKHVKATQLKNIRTHPGVPLAVRRSLK
ncbi:hypothetical protein EC957_008751 [Mortierella hygrophila]|uniref:Uncharacterized protein n=1 Tax=Mortierella hygrophila TaxID=979708 RepID=A0A9P6K5I5_9FUNG|nr:hypothetical protein EC957_008751 [Mortierella hygrophila]